MMIRRITEAINEWEEGDHLLCMDEEIWICAHKNMATKLAIEAEMKKEKKMTEEIILVDYHDFIKDALSKESFDQLPPRKPWDHMIKLVPGAQPIDCKIYPLSSEEQKQLEKFLKENLESGRIRPSKSLMASPFFFIKKKDGKLRPVQDYWKLNEMTIKNHYPLPLIQEIVDKLKGAKCFTKLDIQQGYNNVQIKEGDEWKAAFRTNRAYSNH
jgi:Reverse transcriptase (RNA-dependent DNA polymerase)